MNFPKNLNEIGVSAFTNCYALTAINLSEFSGTLGENAFENCISVTDIKLNPSILELPQSLFAGCAGLKNITIPEGFRLIDDRTFFGCSSLEYIEIPSTVTEIGVRSFSGCTSLKEVNFTTDELMIREGAFENDYSLTDVYFKGVKEIGADAFAHCSSLAWIQLSPKIEYIDSHAFEDCPSLLRIYCEAEMPPVINISTFDSTTEKNATLMVGLGCKERYHMAAYWARFNNVEETNDVPCDTGNVGIELVKISVVDSELSILLDMPCSVEIYSLDGNQVANTLTSDFRMHLQQGIYIVRVGEVVKKIII